VLHTPVNKWLDPMKVAPSTEGASLVSATPLREGTGGGVLVTVGVWISGAVIEITLVFDSTAQRSLGK